MRDEKRLLRKLKREVKRSGGRKLRRFLSNPLNDADDFSYGRLSSAPMNQRPAPEKRSS